MASFQVNSGSVSVSGSGTVVASGIAPGGDGPAHVKVATGTGKRIVVDFVGLAMADALPFAVSDSVSITDDGNGYTTVSK